MAAAAKPVLNPTELARRRSIRVGAYVLVGFFVVVIGAIVGARIHTARSGFTIDVAFSFLSNLTKNARVLLAGGREIGYVQDIFQKDRQTYVRVYLSNDLKNVMPDTKETQIAIFSNNLMGQKYINVQFKEMLPGDRAIQPGQVVRGISPPSFEQMMLSFSSWFEGKSAGEVAEQILAKASVLRADIDAIVAENRDDLNATLSGAKNYFATISEQFANLKTNISLIAQNSEEILTAQQQSLAELVQNTATMAKNLEYLEKALSSNRGTLGKFNKESKQLRDNIRLTIEYSRSFIKCIQERPWVIIYKESCRVR
ncbi:MAG: MCE family protein [Spirochaetes bacterium]|nr:MCE family protein [Spirochaetota bacterium]MBX3723906.1 MCE family protein [Turneriella sp.]